jgi:hypothetical protein
MYRADGGLELVKSNEGEMRWERQKREVEGRNECGVERQELADWGRARREWRVRGQMWVAVKGGRPQLLGASPDGPNPVDAGQAPAR